MYARVLEEGGTVVEGEVDAGQLLPGLGEEADKGAEADLVVSLKPIHMGCRDPVERRSG